MSSPGPSMPEMPTPTPAEKRGSVVPGIVIGVVVLAMIAGGAVAVVRLRDGGTHDGEDGDTKTSARPSAGTPVGPATTLAPGDAPSTDPSLARFYDQKLAWTSCKKGDQCAKLTVPLDYNEPTGTTIKIGVVKVPATGKRIGSLVVNPGGPGGSGIDYATAPSTWPAPIRQSYDLIGFDPRGVASSDPVDCVSDSQLDTFLAEDPAPDTAAEMSEYEAGLKTFAAGCEKNSPDIAAHMSTQEVIRDVDVLRQALGEAKLDYFGASYGTSIGAQYANVFPTHVDKMVLDGAVDPALGAKAANLSQARGFETAFRAYAADCIKRGDCPLGDSVDAASQTVRQFLTSVAADPLPGDGSRMLEAGNALNAIFFPLYVKQYWPYLTQAFQAALKGDGSLMLTLSDAQTERGPNGYDGNLFEALITVNCLDTPDSVSVAEVPSLFPEFSAASPTFGEGFAYSYATCHDWPWKAEFPSAPVTGAGAPPIVVVGTTRDPATPYVQAQALAKELESGVLVSRDGDGHTGFNRGNTCVDSAVEDYLIKGKVPQDGLTC